MFVISPRRTQYSRHTGCRGFPKLRCWIAKYVIHRREFVTPWECEHRKNSANVFHVMVKLALFDVPQKILSKNGILAIYFLKKDETNEKVTRGECIKNYSDTSRYTKCISGLSPRFSLKDSLANLHLLFKREVLFDIILLFVPSSYVFCAYIPETFIENKIKNNIGKYNK